MSGSPTGQEESSGIAGKRGKYKHEGGKEPNLEADERPVKRRNMRKGLQEEGLLSTGTNTPVAEKVRRYEKKVKMKNDDEDNKIQPTLRSFKDHRSWRYYPEL